MTQHTQQIEQEDIIAPITAVNLAVLSRQGSFKRQDSESTFRSISRSGTMSRQGSFMSIPELSEKRDLTPLERKLIK